MTEDQMDNPQSTESARFLESYMNTPDIKDRINLAKKQFESNTDAWVISYYANASKLPQSTIEKDTRILTNKEENRRPVEQTKQEESEKALTPAQVIFKELDQYQLYYKWSQDLKKNSDDPERIESVNRMLDISKRLVQLHFYYDDLNAENKQVVDWLIAKVESDDVSILTTVGSKSQEYTDLVDQLAKKYKSPMFLTPQEEGEKAPQMYIFPDLFDKSTTEFDLLTHLAHERAHDVYFQEESPPDKDNEAAGQNYLIFHEYIAILESQRSYRNLDSRHQRGLSKNLRKFFANEAVAVGFELPGYRDQITTELNPDTFALYHAYKHALETKISAHMNLILAAIMRGDMEQAKKMLENTPGSSQAVGDFKPVKN